MSNKDMPPRSTLEDIKSTLKNHLSDLGERYRVKGLGVFGSYAKGESRSDSDLDLLVEFDETAGQMTVKEIINDLEGHYTIKSTWGSALFRRA